MVGTKYSIVVGALLVGSAFSVSMHGMENKETTQAMTKAQQQRAVALVERIEKKLNNYIPADVFVQMKKNILVHLTELTNSPALLAAQQRVTLLSLTHVNDSSSLQTGVWEGLKNTLNVKDGVNNVPKQTYTIADVVAQLRKNHTDLKTAGMRSSLAEQFVGKKCLELEQDYKIWMAAVLACGDHKTISREVANERFVTDVEFTRILQTIDMIYSMLCLKHFNSNFEVLKKHLLTLVNHLKELERNYTTEGMRRCVADSYTIDRELSLLIIKKVFLPKSALVAAVTVGLSLASTIAYFAYKKLRAK